MKRTATMIMKNQTRRKFIKQSALFAVSVSAFAAYGCEKPENPAVPAVMDECQTTADLLGPFYKRNAPITSDLIIPGHDAVEILVKGHVYMSDCTSPLTDAQVEFWQSDGAGEYDNENFNYRGRLITGGDGAYAFKTIVPGRYLNGSTYRPSHIHFKITAPGYKELVSQIYFKGDPYISSDPMASRPAAQQRILEITTDKSGLDMIHFPIYMSKI